VFAQLSVLDGANLMTTMRTPAEDAALSAFIDAATSDADPGYPQGAFDAAEWSRTITPREGHKALKLNRHRTVERKAAYRAKSDPAVSGCFGG
jgi:hypothetical protein